MATVKGNLIKDRRKQQKLTQKELASGICKQATISNIESRNYCYSIEILSLICSRLNLQINDVIIQSEEVQIRNKLNDVQKLCNVWKNDEALKKIQTIDSTRISDQGIMNQLNYLKGITELLVNNNFDASFFYFSQVISSSDEKDLFAILANMGLGIAYEQKKSYSFAETYYVAAITNVDNRASKELELNKVYFNAAKFYSEIKNYQKAIDLCNKGIKINKQYQSTVLLDFLLYEVAYNTKELNDPTYLTKYDRAYQISSFNENNHVKDTIKIDLKEEFKLLSSSHE